MARPIPFLHRLLAGRRGAVTVLGAAALVASLGCLAFAVDLGSIYFESRRLQGVVDAAALSAAANLNGARDAADAAVAANGWKGRYDMKVETGVYRPDAAVPVAQRFDGGDKGTPDSARVTITTDSPLFFGILAAGKRNVKIQRAATAARVKLASFSIGSRLAALQGGIGNALLGALTGSQVSLSVMDYEALLGADVDLLRFSDALRTGLDLKAATYDDVLNGKLTTGTALQALAGALDAGGSASAASAIRKLAASIPPATPLKLGQLIDLGPIGAQDHASSGQALNVNAFDLARAMLELANGSRQVQLNLGATIPGLADVTAKLSVGDRAAESPWLAVTDKNEPVVRTSQTRLYIEARILPAANTLGIASVRLPLYVELAEAQAKLSQIDCAGSSPRSVSLLVHPSIGHAAIADLYPADIGNHRIPLIERPAQIVAIPLVTVTGQARVDLTASNWTSVSFDANDIARRQVKTVSSNSLVQGIVLSLLTKLNLTPTIIGISLPGISGLVSSLVGNTLSAAAPALDGVLNTLTDLLGIHLGQADVRVNGVRCGVPALVA